jgi:L-fucose isomerase-like protein
MTTVAMIPTARPTFAIDVAKERADAARDLLTELGATVVGPTDLVMTPEDVVAAAEYITPDADLVINVCASFSDASPALALYQQLDSPVLLWSFTEPGSPGDRLWLNSLCGANLFGHALVRSGGQVRLMYGDPTDPAIRQALTEVLAGRLPEPPTQPEANGDRADVAEVTRALDGLRGLTVGVLGDGPPGFTPSEYDPQLLRDLFGIEVVRLDLDQAFAEIQAVEDTTKQAEVTAAVAARPTLKALEPGYVDSFAAVTSALRDWQARDALSAMAIRCWPEFPTQLGVCPCSSMSRIADEGTPTACERDVYGAVTMLLAESLGGGTTYLVDTVDLDAEANIVRVWHCGSAATALAADPGNATQYLHCNRKIGVAGNFPLKTGRVIMARLTEDNDPTSRTGLRLLIAAGESVPEPNRFQGNTAAVRLDIDARTFVHGLVTGGFPHHTVLAWNDIRPQLRQAADQLGISVVEWS